MVSMARPLKAERVTPRSLSTSMTSLEDTSPSSGTGGRSIRLMMRHASRERRSRTRAAAWKVRLVTSASPGFDGSQKTHEETARARASRLSGGPGMSRWRTSNMESGNISG